MALAWYCAKGDIMVQPTYNPFKEKDVVETEHGIITFEAKRYFTHRRPEHFFKKYGGFGISTSELAICYTEHVENIVIKYHGKKKNVIYKIKLDYLKYLPRYDNDGDKQIIIPIKEMKKVGEERGLEEHD